MLDLRLANLPPNTEFSARDDTAGAGRILCCGVEWCSRLCGCLWATCQVFSSSVCPTGRLSCEVFMLHLLKTSSLIVFGWCLRRLVWAGKAVWAPTTTHLKITWQSASKNEPSDYSTVTPCEQAVMLTFKSPFYIVGLFIQQRRNHGQQHSSLGLRVKGVGLDEITMLWARISLIARHCRPGFGLLRSGRDSVARPSEGIWASVSPCRTEILPSYCLVSQLAGLVA